MADSELEELTPKLCKNLLTDRHDSLLKDFLEGHARQNLQMSTLKSPNVFSLNACTRITYDSKAEHITNILLMLCFVLLILQGRG